MFATFKVSKSDIGATKAIVRHRRSTAGCITCRHRRKKCSETKPVCRRCRRNPSVQCLWDDDEEQDPSSYESEAATAISPSPYRAHVPGTPLTFIGLKLPAYTEQTRRGPIPNPTIKATHLDFLVHTFDVIQGLSWADPEYSLVSLGFQDAIHNPCLMYAFAACGAAVLAKGDSRWEAVCLAHHTRSIELVSTALRSNLVLTACDNTWLLAAINALHIFETLRTYDSQPNTFHLTAAVELCTKQIEDGRALTIFQHKVLGEVIFQLVIASTFHPAYLSLEQTSLNMNHLLDALATSCRRLHDGTIDWRVSSHTAMLHDVINWIFRLSYLRLRVPLSGSHLSEARTILASLERWQPSSPILGSGEDGVRIPAEVISTAGIYRCACLIYAHKLIDCALSSSDAIIAVYVRSGVDLLANIHASNPRDTSVTIWAVFIIALATGTTEDRIICRRALQYLLSTFGIGCIRGILDLLSYALEDDSTSHYGTAGLDVLFRDDLLGQIIF